MNKLPRILLLVGGFVLALLIGVLIGRSQRAEPVSGNAQAVQITTTPAPMPAVAAPPLPPAPVPVVAPKAATPPKIAPDQQVQEDAAAVGMTTREGADETAAPPAAPKSASGAGESDNSQPPG
jgi:hypothetical protein